MIGFFRQPGVKIVLVALGIAFFFLLQPTFVGPYLGLAVLFVLFGVMAWGVMKSAYRLSQSLRVPSIRFMARLLREVRKELVVPPVIQLLYAIAWIGSLATTITLLLTKKPASLQIGSMLVFSVIAIAAFFDVLFRVSRIMKRAWAKTIGKILMANVGAAALLLALALAKQQIHALVRVDPKYFEDFARLLAIVYLPFVYVAIGVAALSLFSISQMFCVVIFVLASSIVRIFLPFVEGSKLQRECRVFWYRIRYGKKPAELPKKSIMSLDDIQFFMRPLGTVALVAVISQLLLNSAAYLPQKQTFVARALTEIQYQGNSRCGGLAPGTRVVYLDRGNVSTATVSGSDVVFSVAQCSEN